MTGKANIKHRDSPEKNGMVILSRKRDESSQLDIRNGEFNGFNATYVIDENLESLPSDLFDEDRWDSSGDAAFRTQAENVSPDTYTFSQEYDAALASSPPAELYDILENLSDENDYPNETIVPCNTFVGATTSSFENKPSDAVGTSESLPISTQNLSNPSPTLLRNQSERKRKSDSFDNINDINTKQEMVTQPNGKLVKLGDNHKLPTLDKKPATIWQSRLTGYVTPILPEPDPSTVAAPGIISNGTQTIGTQTREISKDLKPATIFLSPEQDRVLNLIVHKSRNIFFTGAAGTGKSVLLRRVIRELRKKYRADGHVAVTASTGLAACNIGGTTVHSFFGIGLGKEDVDTLLKKVRNNRQALKRWKSVKVLVIDEISMIDGVLFDKLEYMARRIRKQDSIPFGGIQVVITGDFYQLPPVFKQEQDIYGNQLELQEQLLAFQAKSWESVVPMTVELKQVFRQKDDRFSRMLGSIREGNVTKEIEKEFTKLSRPLNVPKGITPTQLYPLRRDVEIANKAQMQKLKGQSYTFNSTDTYNTTMAKKAEILKYLICPESVTVKVGAQVMLIKNMDETLVNGSLGKVLGFMNERSFNIIRELPSEYADGIISGSQSAEEGMLEYLQSQGVSAADIKDSQNFDDNDGFDIPENYEELDQLTEKKDKLGTKRKLMATILGDSTESGKKWPYVRFMMLDGTTRDILVQAEKWDIENLEGKIEASRSQIPLILAWALSIHKCQGQTLHWVKVDLRKIFECGQSYVALSRAVSMDGLQVEGFHTSSVRVRPDVIDFYKSLSSPLDVPMIDDR